MAEVRKITPGRGGHIAAAVEKALGESARRATPGASPDPTKSAPIPIPSAADTPITVGSFLLSEDFVVYADTPADDDD